MAHARRRTNLFGKEAGGRAEDEEATKLGLEEDISHQVRKRIALAFAAARAARAHRVATLHNCVGDQGADRNHQGQGNQKNDIGNLFHPVHALGAPGSQRPIRKYARPQKEERIQSQQIISKSVDLCRASNDPEKPDDGETNTHHRSRHGEDMDGDVGLQRSLGGPFLIVNTQ
jgi:hypothetical protein